MNVSSTTLVLFALVGISFVAIGVSHSTMNDTNVDPQTSANTNTLVSHESDIKQIVKTVDRNDIAIGIVETQIALNNDAIDDIEAFNPINLENKIKALEQKVKDLEDDVDNTRETGDFDLELYDNRNRIKDVFRINDVIYIKGDSDATRYNSVDLEITNEDDAVIYEREIGIPSTGSFTSVYSIPDIADGDYTVTITDGRISDSINFEVR